MLTDVISIDGKRGSKLTAELTLKNQKIMKEAGLRPLPVFHIGEPFEYLEYYIKRYDYISLGGMVGVPKNTLILWLDECFGKHICDEKGMPKVKIHGFGLTSFSLMFRYPWYSCDSTQVITAESVQYMFHVSRTVNGFMTRTLGKFLYHPGPTKEAGQH